MPWFEKDIYPISGTITEFSSWSRQITFDNRHTFVFVSERQVRHFIVWMQVGHESDVIGQYITLYYNKDNEITTFR
jgi:hypothetical protein